MTRLAQIIAVEKGIKSDATRQFTDIHRDVQKAPLLSGISRRYKPRDEEAGAPLPPESTKVQIQAEDMCARVAVILGRLFDVTLTKDDANCRARADVTVAGRVILADVPVTYLLFLEKQLNDLRTFIAKLPLLDPAEEWAEDEVSGTWRTPASRTVRTQKLPRNHVLAEATAQHPAQVQMYTEDVPVGDWETVKYSGAMAARRVEELLTRVTALQHAVKYAREEANAIEVTDRPAGAAVLGYLFAA